MVHFQEQFERIAARDMCSGHPPHNGVTKPIPEGPYVRKIPTGWGPEVNRHRIRSLMAAVNFALGIMVVPQHPVEGVALVTRGVTLLEIENPKTKER